MRLSLIDRVVTVAIVPVDQGVPAGHRRGRGPGDGGRPGAGAGGVDRSHLHVVLRAAGQPSQGVLQGAGARGPHVFHHSPVGIGLVGGSGLDVAQVVGGDGRTAGVDGNGPGYGQGRVARNDWSGDGRSARHVAERQAKLGQVVGLDPSQVLGNAAGQLVAREPQSLQVGQAAQFSWYLPGQLIAIEVQSLQVGEAAQLRRYLPGQLVAREVQKFQVGEAAEPPMCSPFQTNLNLR